MSILSEKNVIPLVIFLGSKDEVVQVELDAVSTNTVKLAQVAEDLESIGILQISITNSPRRTIKYRLTEKGHRLAEAFRQAQAIAASA